MSICVLLALLCAGDYLSRERRIIPAVRVQAQNPSPPMRNSSNTQGIALSSEASGIVTEIRFNSGQEVKQGEVLMRLDSALEEAQRKTLQAQLKQAQSSYQDDQKQLEKKAATQAQVDFSLSRIQQVAAALEEVQNRMKQKTITAPFDGTIDRYRVNRGQYAPAGTTLVTLQAQNPLFVRSKTPQPALSGANHLASEGTF